MNRASATSRFFFPWPTSSAIRCSVGVSPPDGGRAPCLMRARAISRATNGLPSEIRCSRSRMGRVSSPPVRARRRRAIASPPNGATDTRCRLGAGPPAPGRAGRRRNQCAGPPGTGSAPPPGDGPRTPAPWPKAGPATGRRRSRRPPDRPRPARAAPQRRDRHRPLVRWGALDLRSEESGVQRALLRGGQIGQLEVEEAAERRVREPGLRLRRPGRTAPDALAPAPGTLPRATTSSCRSRPLPRGAGPRLPPAPARGRTSPGRARPPARGSRDPVRPSASPARSAPILWASSRRDQSKYLVGLGIGDLDGRLS
jgi:hypothetical protein